MPVHPANTKKRKQAFLEALARNNNLVTHACKEAKVPTSTYYDWTRDDPEFAAAAKKVEDIVLDRVEAVAHEMIAQDKNPAMTIFYLKCKGKKRGYIEKTEVEHSFDISNIKNLISQVQPMYEEEY